MQAAAPATTRTIELLIGSAMPGNITDAALRVLRIVHVANPLGIEGGDVKQIGFTQAFPGAVTQPTLALVALRAVRGNAAVIVFVPQSTAL